MATQINTVNIPDNDEGELKEASETLDEERNDIVKYMQSWNFVRAIESSYMVRWFGGYPEKIISL